MTDPRDQDDSWGELYRELGVDDSEAEKAAPPTELPAEEVVELTVTEIDEAPEPIEEAAESEVEDSDESDDGDFEPSEAGGEDAAGEEEPGQKKRRRRRRRRKKKGGAEQTAGDEGVHLDAEGEADDSETQLEDDDDAEAITGPGADEETSPEMTRDIIANWNVPSWEEIVTGLHRPDR